MIPKLSMYEEKSVAAFFCFEFMYLIEANVASKKWRLDIDLDEERRYEMECGTADDGQRQPGREASTKQSAAMMMTTRRLDLDRYPCSQLK